MPVPDAVVDGSITANAQTVAVNTTGRATADIVLSGTWVGTIQFEFLPDGGTTWYALPCTPVVAPAIADVTNTTANGVWKANVAAFPQVRVRSSAWTSGTATVRIEASEAARSGGSLMSVTGTVGATIADGADAAQGATTDANTVNTVMGRLTKIRDLLTSFLTHGQATMANSLPVTLASDQSALPLPTGAAIEAGHLATIDTNTANIPAKGQALAAGSTPVVLTAIQAASLAAPVVAAGEAHIGAVGGNTVVVQGSFARTADTAIYAIGDAVANATSSPAALVFAGCARVNAGTGLITGAKLVISLNAAASPKFSGELWLFAGTVAPTLSNDNALFTPLTADLVGGTGGPLVAKLPFTVPYVATAASGATGAVVYDADVVNQAFKCGAGVTSLWGLVVTRVAYQPVASEVFTFTLQIAQD